MSEIKFNTKKLPDCCNYSIDMNGKKIHEVGCPETFLRDSIILVACLLGGVLIVGWAIWYQISKLGY